ncbi:hypothetical protein ACIOJ9_34635 [Streptomyces sp. NPDC088175]
MAITTERLALLATFGELHPACDQWLNAAFAVSASARVAGVEVTR